METLVNFSSVSAEAGRGQEKKKVSEKTFFIGYKYIAMYSEILLGAFDSSCSVGQLLSGDQIQAFTC